MIVIFTDPGKNSGFASVRDGKVLSAFEVVFPEKLKPSFKPRLNARHDIDRCIEVLTNEVTERACGMERAVLVCEKPWCNPARVAIFGSLRERCVIWEAAAHLCGISIGPRVTPNEWRAEMTKAGKGREAAKVDSIAAARLLWPEAPEEMSDNVAEAVLGAIYCYRLITAGAAGVTPKPKKSAGKGGKKSC